jgi:hypothetical protein
MQVKRFNWVRRPSQWEFAQAWRNQRREMAQSFMEQGSVASAGFLDAHNNLSLGMANLTTQASIKRVQAQVNAARNQSLNRVA